MADQAGTTLRGYGRCPEYSEFFPIDRFDLCQSIPSRTQTEAEQVRPDGSDMTCQKHQIRVLVTRVRDRFITGQTECSLHRHLDDVGPSTPIRDIVDRCRVWESHAEDTDSCGACPARNDLGRSTGLMIYKRKLRLSSRFLRKIRICWDCQCDSYCRRRQCRLRG